MRRIKRPAQQANNLSRPCYWITLHQTASCLIPAQTYATRRAKAKGASPWIIVKTAVAGLGPLPIQELVGRPIGPLHTGRAPCAQLDHPPHRHRSHANQCGPRRARKYLATTPRSLHVDTPRHPRSWSGHISRFACTHVAFGSAHGVFPYRSSLWARTDRARLTIPAQTFRLHVTGTDITRMSRSRSRCPRQPDKMTGPRETPARTGFVSLCGL